MHHSDGPLFSRGTVTYSVIATSLMQLYYNHYIISFCIQIKESDVDFWGIKFEVLKFKHQVKTYPPRVTMTVSTPSDIHCVKLPVQFEGCSGLDLIEILFPLSNKMAAASDSCT